MRGVRSPNWSAVQAWANSWTEKAITKMIMREISVAGSRFNIGFLLLEHYTTQVGLVFKGPIRARREEMASAKDDIMPACYQISSSMTS